MKIDPLDDGISEVSYYSHMGSDLSVVDAARVSFGKESLALAWEPTMIYEVKRPLLVLADSKLISYLAANNHWTPFGHAQLTLRVKAPIFVARQLVKHQVGLVWNEVSRRYVSDTPEVYLPRMLRLKPAGSIKQGSSEATTDDYTGTMKMIAADAINAYTEMIAAGVAPEEARMVLPLSTYTEWMWTGSLAAWARIIKLRTDPHSQSQTQSYGLAFSTIVQELFPVSAKALQATSTNATN